MISNEYFFIYWTYRDIDYLINKLKEELSGGCLWDPHLLFPMKPLLVVYS